MLPELSVGDWIYVENFGAYTVAAASNFNGFKTSVCKYVVRT
jgi:diaminopimelate decarboxylase